MSGTSCETFDENFNGWIDDTHKSNQTILLQNQLNNSIEIPLSKQDVRYLQRWRKQEKTRSQMMTIRIDSFLRNEHSKRVVYCHRNSLTSLSFGMEMDMDMKTKRTLETCIGFHKYSKTTTQQNF